MKDKNKNLLLIDGNALLFKSFYATFKQLQKEDELRIEIENKLKNNEAIDSSITSFNFTQRDKTTNEAINAIRPFLFSIINLINQFDSEYVLIAFDKGKKTFRHKKDYYKSNRKVPKDIIPQFNLSRNILNMMGIRFIEHDELEADDIIGIYSNFAKKNNLKADIITIDKDLLQLVDKDINVYLSKNGVKDMILNTEENFLELNSVRPNQIADLKALMGDSSDCIKGVSGIGPKTAIKLINEYQNIDNLVKNLDNLPKTQKEKISKEIDLLFEYRDLTKIIQESDLINVSLDFIKLNKQKNEDLINFLHSKNIYSLTNKLKKEW